MHERTDECSFCGYKFALDLQSRRRRKAHCAGCSALEISNARWLGNVKRGSNLPPQEPKEIGDTPNLNKACLTIREVACILILMKDCQRSS